VPSRGERTGHWCGPQHGSSVEFTGRGDTVEEVDVLACAMLSERRANAVSFHAGAVAGTNFASFRRF
jgi:hypothetical protein